MAQQLCPFYITGCYDNITFYRMDGKYYARLKSSLQRKRVKTDPSFRKTMQYAALLGKASEIASRVYRALPKEEKEHSLYRKLTGMAMLLLKKGETENKVIFILNRACSKEDISRLHGAAPLAKDRFAEEILYRIFHRQPVYTKVGFLMAEGMPP